MGSRKRHPECDLDDHDLSSHCYSQCHAARDGDCFWKDCPQPPTPSTNCPLHSLCAFHDALTPPPKPKKEGRTMIDKDKETKRDLFAFAALQGMLAHPTRYRPRAGAPSNWHDAIAQEAYEIADAMERAAGTEQP